jgi:hypothetical protein
MHVAVMPPFHVCHCVMCLHRTGFHQILSPAASLATIISYQPEASALLNNWSNILNLIARYVSGSCERQQMQT